MLSNQWGRGGGSSGSRSGSGGLVLAVVVSLVIGAAAGYGVFRMLDVTETADLAAEHERTVAQLRAELEHAASTSTDSTVEMTRLTEANVSLRRQIEALRESIDKSEAVLQAENARLKQEAIPALQGQNLDLAERIADLEHRQNGWVQQVEDGERRISALTADLNRAKQALKRQSEQAGDAAVRRLEGEVASLRKDREAQKNGKVAVERDLARAQGDLAASRRERDALQQKSAGLERDVARLTRDLQTSRADLDRQTARNRDLVRDLRRLQGELRAAPAKRSDDSGLTPPPGEDEPTLDVRSPRNAALVQRALRATPGLTRLSPGEKAQLERQLTAGGCVTEALDGVFDRVPVLALRNLMRDLDSDC